MERLTDSNKEIPTLVNNAEYWLKVYFKLKDYEDFEVRKGFVLEETYHISRKPLLVVRYDDNSLKSHSGYLGISVFLTKSEAEAKLKELRGKNE